MSVRNPDYKKGCCFSDCWQYRYTLWRHFGFDSNYETGRYCMFIGLNPSTADETKDDPTIRRCKAFAQREGFQSMVMTNLFAYRATAPSAMKAQVDPVGDMNNDALLATAKGSALIIAAWGTHGGHDKRDVVVRQMLRGFRVKCFGTTKQGFPKHPLYLRADSPLLTYL